VHDDSVSGARAYHAASTASLDSRMKRGRRAVGCRWESLDSSLCVLLQWVIKLVAILSASDRPHFSVRQIALAKVSEGSSLLIPSHLSCRPSPVPCDSLTSIRRCAVKGYTARASSWTFASRAEQDTLCPSSSMQGRCKHQQLHITLSTALSGPTSGETENYCGYRTV
jgi:hypothetical protein